MGSHLSLLLRLKDKADEHWPKLIGKKGRGGNKLSKVFGELAPATVLMGLCILFFGNVPYGLYRRRRARDHQAFISIQSLV